jgi:hypothetical protein
MADAWALAELRLISARVQERLGAMKFNSGCAPVRRR